jgi:hypothetical protein
MNGLKREFFTRSERGIRPFKVAFEAKMVPEHTLLQGRALVIRLNDLVEDIDAKAT